MYNKLNSKEKNMFIPYHISGGNEKWQVYLYSILTKLIQTVSKQ